MFSRLGKTNAAFGSLHDAGRLDIVYECIVTSLFLSHGIRRDVTFHASLNGAPKPPLHIKIDGVTLYDVRTDVDTWQQILRKTIAGKTHPGITADKTSFEALIKTEAETHTVYVLEEGGQDVAHAELADDAVFGGSEFIRRPFY